MAEPIRPSTELPANRSPFTLITADGETLVGEVASPIGISTGAILCLHPLPTAGGMMDSHILKKAANRLPDMAGITVVRFNTRGTTSANGASTGTFDNGGAERFDVEAALTYCLDTLKLENLWVVGWSFGTDLALRHAKDARLRGLILLSPPLRTSEISDLEYWNHDGRPVFTIVPELDDYLQPAEAAERFSVIGNHHMIAVEGAKHLWVGEPSVYRVLSEITQIIAPDRLPLPTEI
jgi:alpha/beta superfamily hydrolase